MPALADFDWAKDEISKDQKAASVWVPRLFEIPNGFLDLCNKTIELSKEKVADWLDEYMFKDGEKRGAEIAGWLGKFDEHKTHSRPINFSLAKEKGLKVSLMEEEQALQEKILSVFHATLVTFDVAPCVKIVKNHLGKGSYVVVRQQ